MWKEPHLGSFWERLIQYHIRPLPSFSIFALTALARASSFFSLASIRHSRKCVVRKAGAIGRSRLFIARHIETCSSICCRDISR